MSVTLSDQAARLEAMTHLDRTMWVEAGAGSGKTSVLAGRMTALLANGVLPRNIAAVTFTEMAAGELLARITRYVQALVSHPHSPKAWPLPLQPLFGQGLSESSHTTLRLALAHLDELTCTTIHGFCQRLLKPYPVEANLDPMARVMDEEESKAFFARTYEDWLRQHVSAPTGCVLEAFVGTHLEGALKHLAELSPHLRQRPELLGPSTSLEPALAHYHHTLEALKAAYHATALHESTTASYLKAFEAFSERVSPWPQSDYASLFGLLSEADEPFLTNEGKPRKMPKSWWERAKLNPEALANGKKEPSKAVLTQHHATLEPLYLACVKAYLAFKGALSNHMQGLVLEALKPMVAHYQAQKRRLGLLDFEDLIAKARHLLREHSEVRVALAQRYTHVLVDEFQDTDLGQIDIFWRLCGEPTQVSPQWHDFRIRPGALFVVGDPKQAIYGFRGADIEAYRAAKATLEAQGDCAFVSIAVNFRSKSPLLDFVNTHFEPVLSQAGQCGFEALRPLPAHETQEARVLALPFASVDNKSESVRDSEAQAIAKACQHLLATYTITDPHTQQPRRLEPRDIALLAPTGTSLWHYEAALEACALPVASQAGKNFYARQEVKDLIALSMVLSNPRDAFALGVVLRNPLVGLSDEELLDIVAALPRDPTTPERIPLLHLDTPLEAIPHPLAREVMAELAALAKHAMWQTPYQTLSQALARLRVLPLLKARLGPLSERALNNVRHVLELSKRYACQGLAAFAQAMYHTWADEENAREASSDSEVNALSLLTMHAAKGLEWPVVMLINTNTKSHQQGSFVVSHEDLGQPRLHGACLEVKGDGYEQAKQQAKQAKEFETQRLWYVASTRAREWLVLPWNQTAPPNGESPTIAWDLSQLAPLDLDAMETSPPLESPETGLALSYEAFQAEWQHLKNTRQRLSWEVPSRSESVLSESDKEALLLWSEEGEAFVSLQERPKGSALRGDLLHTLLEEVLTEVLSPQPQALHVRACELLAQVGETNHISPSLGLCASELAQTVLTTLALPEVAALRPNLLSEVPVYGSQYTESGEVVTFGYIDALALDAQGQPEIVIDWKSDVAPTQATLEHYVQQVRSYMVLIGAKRGLIVLMSQGKVLPVLAASPTSTGQGPLNTGKGQLDLGLAQVGKGQLALF